MTAVLTAFNDEASIGQAVDDFAAHPLVRRVPVIDNNSVDRTSEVAQAHGAIVHRELRPGYGRCVHRALTEAAAYPDNAAGCIVRGRHDLPRPRHRQAAGLLGPRPRRERHEDRRAAPVVATQLTTFMYYGNFVVAKVLELKHLGKGTISDVGTTYKLCRSDVTCVTGLAMFGSQA